MSSIIIFTTLILSEAALAVYRIGTRSAQRKVTVMLRGASVLLLFALDALSVITWGLRYYALAAVLTISAIVNAVLYLKNSEKKKKIKPPRVIIGAAGIAVLLILSMLPAVFFPEYRPIPVTGEYQIETAVKYYTDESRAETYSKSGGVRTLAAEFWYPANGEGNYPLIVFSHGAFGTRTSNESLFRELASHGYVVCSIDHTYQCLYTADKSGKSVLMSGDYFKEINAENAREDRDNSLTLYKKWMAVRTADINFVIDTIKTDTSDSLYGIIDARKTGVMGHSLGGAAALGIGRLRDDIGAVIALEAPFMCDILDVQNGEFVFENAEYPAPVLNVYSDSSWPHLKEWPQYAQNAELLTDPTEDAFNLHIAGAGHLSLTDLSLASPIFTRILNGHPSSLPAEECLRIINKECLAFFDCYLKDPAPYTLP